MSKEQEIRDMAKLSVLSNSLNDIQLKNLKMFPMVFFNGVSVASINYDLHIEKPMVSHELENANDPEKMDIKYNFDRPKQNAMIEYRLTVDESQDNNDADKRFLALEKSVRNIFWKEVKIVVFFNDKKVYESKDV